MSLLHLPNELLLLIQSHLENPTDLSALCQTNRRLAHVFIPLLHHLAVHKIEYGVVALHWSAAIGNEPLVRLILENASGIDVMGYDTMIHESPNKCTDKAIADIMSRGARITVSEDKIVPLERFTGTSLFWAIRRHQEALVGQLLQMGACDYDNNEEMDYVDSAFHWAVRFGSENIIRLFIDNGVDIEARDSYGSTPLCNAINESNKPAITLLLEAGVDVNCQDEEGCTPLHLAAVENDVPLVKLLLKNGAGRSISIEDNNGDTPLGLLLGADDDSPLMMLLLKYADGEFRWQGSTALHIAAECGLKGMIRQLLDNGIDINGQDGDGHTALHLAVLGGHNGIAKVLIQEGASLECEDYASGFTALDMARMKRSTEIVDYILWFGDMEDRILESFEGHSRKGKRY